MTDRLITAPAHDELDCEQCYGSGYLTTDEGCERECAYCGGTGVEQLTQTHPDPFGGSWLEAAE